MLQKIQIPRGPRRVKSENVFSETVLDKYCRQVHEMK